MTHPADVDPDRYYLEQALRLSIRHLQHRGNLARKYEDLLGRMDEWYQPQQRYLPTHNQEEEQCGTSFENREATP